MPFTGPTPNLKVELLAAKSKKQFLGFWTAILSITLPTLPGFILIVSLEIKSNPAAPAVLYSGKGKLLSNLFIFIFLDIILLHSFFFFFFNCFLDFFQCFF